MRCGTLAGGVALALLSAGCSTVENFTDGWQGRTEPYGGVRLAKDRFGDDNGLAMCWPFYFADLGLSAVADTITLPIAWAAGWRHIIEDYYSAEGKPVDPAWRRFWFNDLPTAEAERSDPITPAPSPPSPVPSPATPSAGR